MNEELKNVECDYIIGQTIKMFVEMEKKGGIPSDLVYETIIPEFSKWIKKILAENGYDFKKKPSTYRP